MYNKKALLEILKNMDSAKAPAKKKDIIVDPMGQWAHPGKVTRIPSNDITMAGVPYPVYGVDNMGFGQMMYPGQNYTFPGDYVDEYPLYQAKKGGIKSKKYSKSLLATNRLFKKNPMFKKKKYKGKTYDPMAMYFQEGGEQACPPGYMWNGLECVINPYDYKPTSRPAFSMTGDGQYRLDPTYDVFAKQRSYVEDSNREAQEFNKRYVQSKNFQRLLRKQGYTPEEIDKRIDAVMGINDFRYVDEGPSWVGTNDSGRDFISYNVTDPGDWPGFDQIAAHEWGHVGVDSGSLPLKPKEREEFINRLKEGAAGITGNPDDLLHDMEPQENRADLTQLRQQLQQAGVFDSTKKKKFTKKDLEKYRKIMDSTEENWHNMWNRMFRLYDDEDIIWFMNNIAQKDADQDLNMAEYGGDISIPELTKAQKGGAPTYADSLALYNFNKLQRQLEKPSDLVPSSTQIITLGYSGAITAEGIRKQKILQAEVDRILREHPNIRLGTHAARNQPRYVRNRYGDLVRNFRANSDYEGYVNANGSWDLYHPDIVPKGTWVGLAKNNDYSNVKPKGTPSPAPLPKFEINQVYTFADRPNSYYKMTPEGKMYIKNKDTGNKFVPISDDYAARVKVLREGLTSGKTKKYNPPVPPGHEHTGTLNYVDCKNPPPTAGEVQAEVLAAGLGPTAEGARRISKAALDRAEWEKRCAAQNKPVEQTPPKQKVERVELIDAAPEEGEKLQRVDFSKYVKVDYPTEISNKVTFIDEKGRVKTELQYYDVKPDTTPAESVETKTPETQPVRKWDAKANKFVTVEVPYNSVEAKRERAKKEYEARKEYGYRSQTILEPDPKKPGSFKTKEVKSVKYAGPENLDPPRILYYNPETQEYTPDKFEKGGLIKAQAGLTKFSPGRGLGLMDDLGNYVDDIGRAASRLNQFSKINPAVATNTYRDFSVNRPSLGSFSDDFDFMTPEQRRQALKEQMKKWDAENPFSFDMPEDTSAWALDKAIRDEILPEGGLTDVGGFNYLQLDDDIHLGNPWYHYQKEDFSEENWRDIAKRMADEEFMKGLNKKDMLPGSPNHGPINIGDFNYRDFSPGFNYMQKIKSMYAGPQVQLGSQDFFTNQEFKNLMEQRRKYLNAREIFDMDYPEKSYIDENGFTVWGDPNARDELFSLLFPNVGMPNFLSKFTTPTQKVKLQRDGMTLTPGPYLERFALEKYQDAPYDNLQKGAMQLMNDKNGYYTWLEDMDPKMLVKEFGYQFKLKKEDIDNATPEQIEAWRRKIIDGAKQREEERARKSIKSDLENPFKVSHFYENLPLNKYGGLPEAQLGALIKYAPKTANLLSKGLSYPAHLTNYLTTQTPLANAYKINPFARTLAGTSFIDKVSPSSAYGNNNYYQMLGTADYNNLLNSGLLQPNFMTREVANKAYEMPYLVEVNADLTPEGIPFTQMFQNIKSGMYDDLTEAQRNKLNFAPVEGEFITAKDPRVKIYKRHWLKGYAPVDDFKKSAEDLMTQTFSKRAVPVVEYPKNEAGYVIRDVEPKINVYEWNAPNQVIPGRSQEDVSHKMSSLKKDLDIGFVGDIASTYFPSLAPRISLAKDTPLLVSPEGRLWDSNTRYWLARSYGQEPSINQVLPLERYAKEYGDLIYSTDYGSLDDGEKLLDYRRYFSNPWRREKDGGTLDSQKDFLNLDDEIELTDEQVKELKRLGYTLEMVK